MLGKVSAILHGKTPPGVESDNCAARTARASRLTTLTIYLGLGVAGLFLLAAALNGVQLSIRPGPVILTLVWVAALVIVRRRYRGPRREDRLATGAGAVLALFAGGLAGGLVCLVGQTFALPFIDPLLNRADALLGFNAMSFLQGIISLPGLPALLVVAYNSSFPLIFLSVLFFAWTGRAQRVWEICFAFNLCLGIVVISSALFPATGPFLYQPIPLTLQRALPPGAGTYYLGDLFALRGAKQFVIDPTRLQGVAVFPSFHTMLALITASGWRDVRRVRVPMAFWQGLVILSALPIGGHYLTDLLAGAACWAMVYFVWEKAVLMRDPLSR